MAKSYGIAVVALLCLGGVAYADVFNMGPGLSNLETVTVGDPGNVGKFSGSGTWYDPYRTCGSVDYTYKIGKFEVTAAQYTDFLNNKAESDPYGLYSTAMMSGSGCNIQREGASGSYTYSVTDDDANKPVNYASYWSSLRFVNWLNNGQGNGDTETGAYTLGGYNGPDGSTIQRNVGAKWFLPSEDEWYKAAYYKCGGTNAGYWDYATQSDTAPGNQITDPDSGNNANYSVDSFTIGSTTNVGEFENSKSAYGTFDQSGNVWEWNETIIYQESVHSYRGMRGGSVNSSDYFLRASDRSFDPSEGSYDAGFRIAAAVPEPSSVLALVCGIGGLAWRKKRCH